MREEKFYNGPKEMSGMLKSLFRNQSIFIWRSVKQTDQKANMLISLSFYALLIVIIVLIQFDTYLHFPVWILLIPGVLVLLCIIECLYTVMPNTRLLKKLFTRELRDTYPDSEYHNMFGFIPCSLNTKERNVDAMIGNHPLQLGNIIRGHFVASRYANHKFSHMDRAYNYFLWSITSMLLLFVVSTLLAEGHFHEHKEHVSSISYNMDEPDAIFILDKDLMEISGLSFNNNDKFVYAINDEKGKYFKISPTSGEIVSEYKFGNDGDYEGIEVVGDQIIINNSKGDFFITTENGNESIIQYTDLKRVNDVEGIGIDPSDGNLIIACKGEPWKSNADKVLLKYYSNIDSLSSEPFLNISVKDMKAFVDMTYQDESMKQALKRRLSGFSPSGVAIKKDSEDIYIITAQGSILAVYDKNKQVKDIIHLNELSIPQPEGICFDDKNNLYIGTESHGGEAKIYKYKTLN